MIQESELLRGPASRPSWRDAAGVVAAATVPLLSIAALAAADARWLYDPSPTNRTEAVAWLILVQAAVAAIWAPLMGLFAVAGARVQVAAQRAQGTLSRLRTAAWALGWRMMLRATVATAMSAAIVLALQSSFDATALVRSHAMLWAAVLASATLGAAFAASVARPLDAAAAAIGLSAVAVTALFAAGPALDGIPQPVLKAALVANPVVATAAGANLDLFRMNFFYQLSPLAHRQVDYPTAAVALSAYGLTAVVMLLAAAARLDRRSPAFTTERMTP